MKKTAHDGLIANTTDNYINRLDPDLKPPITDLKEELLYETCNDIKLYNTTVDKTERYPIPKTLYPYQIAKLMLYAYDIVNISYTDNQYDTEYTLLGIYQETGPNAGIYMTDSKTINNTVRQFNHTGNKKDIEETLAILFDMAPVRKLNDDPEMVPVNNGIFNYRTKILEPFTPDIVLTKKSGVNYNANAANPCIHNDDDGSDWDVETWIAELTDDPEITELLWEIIGAVLRPFVRWNKAALLYSTRGNNGKGTFCELLRNLLGGHAHTSIALGDFGKDFLLEPLVHAMAIITDENDVGLYIDKAANLKAIITNDIIQINRKFKTPISFRFHGFMVQCLNEMPMIRDKSDSFYRRQLFIPFTKCFTGRERKYIKTEYLKRQDVLEYVMYKVLNMDYYALSEPAACQAALSAYKEYNDPMRQFVDEILPECVWELLPFTFLYALYKAWFQQNYPSAKIIGRNKFIEDLCNTIDPTVWDVFRDTNIKMGTKMKDPEPLILQYDLNEWKNPNYRGNVTERICTTQQNPNKVYRGLLKK